MFYAQVLGLWLLLISLATLVHQPRFKKIASDTLNNPEMMTFAGVVALGIGLLIVVTHNIWVYAWPVLVTLVGWFFIIQGIMRIFWPEAFAKMMRDLMAKSGYTIMTWAWFIIGLYLTWIGFMS
jgi:uncharacterized protein YjeT (DUF2065 family)